MHWIRLLYLASLAQIPRADPRELQIFDPFAACSVSERLRNAKVTSTFPAGVGITVSLPGNKTSSGVDGGELDLLVGEVLLGISLNLPQGYFFNVDQARVRIVFAYLTQSQARSGECGPDQLGPVSSQVVQPPLSSRFGAAAQSALGSSKLDVQLQAAFLSGGDYRLCFSDDGSFSSGHADLLNVVLKAGHRSLSPLSCRWEVW